MSVSTVQAKSTSESRYWCSEAASLFPKARTAADTAITALMPPPPPPPGSAEEAEAGEKEGDDSAPEKKREDPAEYAAKVRLVVYDIRTRCHASELPNIPAPILNSAAM